MSDVRGHISVAYAVTGDGVTTSPCIRETPTLRKQLLYCQLASPHVGFAIPEPPVFTKKS